MKTILPSAFVLAGVLAAATLLQVSPAGTTGVGPSDQGGFTLARKEPEPPAHPDPDSSDPDLSA